MASSSYYFQSMQADRNKSNMNAKNGIRTQAGFVTRNGQPLRSLSDVRASPYNQSQQSPKPKGKTFGQQLQQKILVHLGHDPIYKPGCPDQARLGGNFVFMRGEAGTTFHNQINFMDAPVPMKDALLRCCAF
ncbi:hypothetical protein SADUNF_Sadunf04G0095600 [Salix dunnii]|uniref:Uncharacterized protein n=1 Tax=Salix dunnii TaxID=1413687 RepID=A0A835KFH6_9ROSI|nr:hypothetical protein SADUNF_Sadunf04G0095600 [Salix dunnii]